MGKDTLMIVDYGSGNLRSAVKAFECVSWNLGLDNNITVSSDPDMLARADRIVLPGVGAFSDCMQGLSDGRGMIEALHTTIIETGKPFLGICVGMQLLANIGRENGDHLGLGWIPGTVTSINPRELTLKIPHIGWNDLILRNHAHHLLDGIESGDHFYFVHSYKFNASNPSHIFAHTTYGGDVPAVVGRDNIVGTQFHPEKSQKVGLRFIKNFLTWTP